MQTIITSIFDHKMEAYLDPFHVPTIGLAQRAFSDAVNSPSHQFGKHPADYTLFCLGKFENEDASYEVNKKSLGNGVEYLKSPGHPELPREVDPNSTLQSNQESGNPA